MGAALPLLEASLTLNETLNETFDGDGDMTSQIGPTLYVAPEINAGKATTTYNQKVKNLLFFLKFKNQRSNSLITNFLSLCQFFKTLQHQTVSQFYL